MSPALSLLPALLLAATAAAAEPECPTKCGDVDIPYPFGIGAGCSRSKGFEISCINNGTTAALCSATHTIPVTSLSVAPLPEARVMLPVAYKCYSSAGYPVKNSDGHVDLSAHGVYRISDARNMFVVLGCNTGAFTMNSGADDGDGGRYDYQYYMGCFTYCSGPGSPRDGRCASVGCCHVDIPPGLTDNAVYFEHWPHNGMEHSPCDIAFLVDKDGYEFRASDLHMDESRSSMPVWLDWAIREDDDALSCAAAKGSAGYACAGVNSECVDSLNGPGYFCRCKQGFEGNPYKDEDGCTDYSEVIKSRAVGPEEELVARDQQSPHELEQDMAASQTNKATMKGVEDTEGGDEMPGWWEKAAKKVREEEAAALEKKKQEEYEERQKEKWRMTFREIDMRDKLKKKCEMAEEKRLKDWRERTAKLWAWEAAKKEREHKRFIEKVVHEASLIR